MLQLSPWWPSQTQPVRQFFRGFSGENPPWRPRSFTLLRAPQGHGQIPPCFQGQGTTGSQEQWNTHSSIRKHVLNEAFWAPHAAVSVTGRGWGESQPMKPQEAVEMAGEWVDRQTHWHHIWLNSDASKLPPSSHVPHLCAGHTPYPLLLPRPEI